MKACAADAAGSTTAGITTIVGMSVDVGEAIRACKTLNSPERRTIYFRGKPFMDATMEGFSVCVVLRSL